MTNSVGGPNSSQKRRVAILTAASLSRNPRAFKEAETFARAGFEVIVYGACFEAGQRQTDEELAERHGFCFKSLVPVGENGLMPQTLAVWQRMRTRIGVDLKRSLHIENPW